MYLFKFSLFFLFQFFGLSRVSCGAFARCFHLYLFRYQLGVIFSPSYTYYKNWTIRVQPKPESVSPRLEVHTSLKDPNVAFDNEEITVVCYAKDIQKRDLQLFERGYETVFSLCCGLN